MILRGDYPSEILHTTANLHFMIPEGSSGPYKVVYLLHGMHGSDSSWITNSMLPYFGKKYNSIFVMPDVARSFYCDLKYGRKYFSYVSEELPAICKKIFNISCRPEDTAIMGYSMGAFGSLVLALSKPGQYGFCGAISTACLYFQPILDTLREDASEYLETGDEAAEILKDLYSIYGEGLEYKPEKDVVELIKNYPDNKLKPKIYLTCGTEDDLLEDNRKFRDFMKETKFDYTYEEWHGGHDWDFFNEGLKKSLEFWYKG